MRARAEAPFRSPKRKRLARLFHETGQAMSAPFPQLTVSFIGDAGLLACVVPEIELSMECSQSSRFV